MNSINLKQKKNKLLYRELFLEASKMFKKQVNSLKAKSFCKSRKVCCKVRYTSLSPSEIFSLKQEDETISDEYIKLFLPYGADNSFDYEANNKIDLSLNNKLASKINEKYVKLVNSKSKEPSYFYFCKNLNEDDSCVITGNGKPHENFLCRNYPSSVTTLLPEDCGYREWQKQAIAKIKNDISKDILIKLKQIHDYRHEFECNKTGTCCHLASSEFSYEELKEKAKNGDNFASQFTGIFIPYESVDEAKKVFPEYIDFIFSTLGENEKIYFYHCPNIGTDNLCSNYENRPQICRDFPNNPLTLLPPQCSFNEWKEEVTVAAMLLHALVNISEFYLEKLENV